MAAAGEERLCAPREVAAPEGSPWAAVGNGFASYRAALAGPLAAAARALPDLLPSAEDLFPQALADLAAGRVVAAVDARPVYLREHTAWRRDAGSRTTS